MLQARRHKTIHTSVQVVIQSPSLLVPSLWVPAATITKGKFYYPLSPLLFSVFINPLLSAIPGLVDHLVCYIDDIAVIHTTREGITKAIADIRVYLARLGLLLNPTKSNVVVWPKKLVLVKFGQENWFWPILARKTGF